jgi:hypothetical protein
MGFIRNIYKSFIASLYATPKISNSAARIATRQFCYVSNLTAEKFVVLYSKDCQLLRKKAALSEGKKVTETVGV